MGAIFGLISFFLALMTAGAWINAECLSGSSLSARDYFTGAVVFLVLAYIFRRN